MHAFFNTALRAAFLAVLFAASGCGAIVKGTGEEVTVMTEPAGAACEAVREGAMVAVIKSTPETFKVDRDKDDIVVTCELADYQTAVGRLVPEFGAATMGNVVFGGVIGLAVDAASGANFEYPKSITLVMMPNRFSSAAQRDHVYGLLKGQVHDRFAVRITDLRTQCGGSDICDLKIKRVEAERDAEVAELDKERLAVVIADGG